MKERERNQKDLVDGIAAGRVGFVRPARQPRDRLHAPPPLVAADSRHRGEVHQAKQRGRAQQRADEDRQDAAIAIGQRRPPLRRCMVLTHLSPAMSTPASSMPAIAETIAPYTKLDGQNRSSTWWTPPSTTQPRKSFSTRTTCSGTPPTVADQPSWNRSVSATTRRPGASTAATRRPGRSTTSRALPVESRPCSSRRRTRDTPPSAACLVPSGADDPSRPRQPQGDIAVEGMPACREEPGVPDVSRYPRITSRSDWYGPRAGAAAYESAAAPGAGGTACVRSEIVRGGSR